jgi:AcrR family transcriptional regulator
VTEAAARGQARARRAGDAAGSVDPGTYAKGKIRASGILDSAIALLIDHGYHNLSMRKVAGHAGVRLGNLQHYYPTRDDLVKAMLDRMIEGYLARFEKIRRRDDEPELEFRAIVESVMLDLGKRRTTVFFPELWSLSNHEPHVTQYMDQMYGKYRQVLGGAIARMNPALSPTQVHRLALFVSASVEGHTVFIGYRKPWARETAPLLDMALQAFVWLIRSGRVPE